MVLEAESKLKKALNKIEEQSSSFTRESQNLRQKLYNYEQNKKAREERELKKRQEDEAFTQIMTDMVYPDRDVINERVLNQDSTDENQPPEI